MTLERIDPDAPARLTGWGSDLVVAAQIAERVNMTEFVPVTMRGKPDVVTAAILYGAEIGVGPMQALNSIHVVEGRPQPSAELMRAMIFSAGHHITTHEATGLRVRVSGIRSGRPESERVSVEWTLDMARAAGLLGRKNWQSHPRAMLMARATGDLARWLFPDVIKGLGYVAEDATAAMEPPELEPESGGAEPKPRKALQRRRKPAAAPEPTDEPAEPPRPPRPRPEPAIPPPSVTYAKEDEPLPGDPPRPQLPELAPESPAPEPPPPGQAIGPGMLRGLHAALARELGTVATREEKLAMLTAILGRPIQSSKELTPGDGATAAHVLGQIGNGSKAWRFDDEKSADGVPVIQIHDVWPDEPRNEQPS